MQVQEQTLSGRLIKGLIHFCVWAVFAIVIFYYQPLLSSIEIPWQFWLRQTVTLALLVLVFYLNSSVLVPKLLFKNRRFFYFLIIMFCVAGIVFIHRWMDRAFQLDHLFEIAFRDSKKVHYGPPNPDPKNSGGLGNLLTIVISILVVGISTAVVAIQKWQQDNLARKELEKEKVDAELVFLKAQINPHFFFNTLNNIYALTELNPKLAGEAIHQLSKMMRHLIYDVPKGENMLSQEIAFVKNYTALMKLRLTDTVSIRLETPEDIRDMPLAPMIFLPFVENAFKHGTSTVQPGFIDIRIIQKDKILELTVNNSVMKDNQVSLDAGNGIGLANTCRRLDLLYPGRYKLDVCESGDAGMYSVNLVLHLI